MKVPNPTGMPPVEGNRIDAGIRHVAGINAYGCFRSRNVGQNAFDLVLELDVAAGMLVDHQWHSLREILAFA